MLESMPSVSIFSLTAGTGTPNCTILKNLENLKSSQALGPTALGEVASLVIFSLPTLFSSATTSGKSRFCSGLTFSVISCFPDTFSGQEIEDNYNIQSDIGLVVF